MPFACRAAIRNGPLAPLDSWILVFREAALAADLITAWKTLRGGCFLVHGLLQLSCKKNAPGVFVRVFFLRSPAKKTVKKTSSQNGKTTVKTLYKNGKKTVKKRSGNINNGKKTVHKPENAREHLVKGVCPYRAGRNDCQMGPGCLPEAAGPKKTMNKR